MITFHCTQSERILAHLITFGSRGRVVHPFFMDTGMERPLDPCCLKSRYDRIPRLLKSANYHVSDKVCLLHSLVEIYAPTRLYELCQTLFGVFATDCPFWGVCDTFLCDSPNCRRELHVILMDDILIETADQMARQLYDLVTITSPSDLAFRKATNAEKERARRMLTNLAFLTRSEPSIGNLPRTDQFPDFWITETLCNALAFLVAHETTHLGKQKSIDTYRLHIPGALEIARQNNIQLGEYQTIGWAKELDADVDALMIMSTDRLCAHLDEAMREGTYRCVTAGAALALKAWDLLMLERCYGKPQYQKMTADGHPPARARIAHVLRSARTLSDLHAVAGDDLWAIRIIDALEDLHL
ncbi:MULTISPECIES: hypothetical protein [unclassified Mesorhizobium]|uniref:hypothetical protein n=1 Tax=unclassified Mesorhizobium TaxID=325217 RepID=UPI002414D830|nr:MULTISPECIES: hypothetical protein [unclassified Mesorhizobium]MDG4851354.1 hypothetical protein [Mesorhizobium sp. WSM4982]MDG4912632.1 hypothetical protein [Mesorhizobium sp. WSM4983]